MSEVKTLPEILHTLWINAELFQHKVDNKHTVDMRTPDNHKEKAQEAIAKELMGCLPEERELPPINSEWQEGWMWREGGVTDYNQALDEVRARLTAFIGKGEK